MAISDFLSGLISPVTDLIGKLVTTDKDRAEAQLKLETLRNEIASKLLDYESKLLESQSAIIQAEAKGASWMQRNWRPITMLTFLILVVCDSFG